MSDDKAFEVGDLVRLRVDGSPAMVVEAIESDGTLLCAWKDGAGRPTRHAFPRPSLRAVEPAPATPATTRP